jgi:hypothetical protein
MENALAVWNAMILPRIASLAAFVAASIMSHLPALRGNKLFKGSGKATPKPFWDPRLFKTHLS